MAIDWAAFRFPSLQRWLEPPPLLLIEDGKVLHRHLRIELMSLSELETKLREHGIADPREVAKAYIEPDGQVTVLKKG